MISEEKIDNCNDVMVPLLFRAIFQSEGDKTDIEREGGREGGMQGCREVRNQKICIIQSHRSIRVQIKRIADWLRLDQTGSGRTDWLIWPEWGWYGSVVQGRSHVICETGLV